MATQIVPVHPCADGQGMSQADVAAHAAASHVRTAPLPSAFAPAVAEQHRIEAEVSAMRNGETRVINGTPVTAVSLEVAEALTRYETASQHAAELAAQSAAGKDLPAVDVRSWEFAEELMAGARATLADAGMLHLIGGAS